jgi:PAS domain S-box-containing protein
MENGKRGFLLTGQEAFQESYTNAHLNFSTTYRYLLMLMAESGEEPYLLTKVRARVERWITQSALPEITDRRAGKSAVSLLKDGRSESLMNEIRESISAFAESEENRSEKQDDSLRNKRILQTAGFVLMCVLATAALVVSSFYTFALCRKQLSRLEAAETRISSIINHILDGMIAVDEQGVIRSMNPAAKRMFACTDQEMVGHKFVQLVPEIYLSEAGDAPVTCAWDKIKQRTGSVTLALGRTRRQTSFPMEVSLSEMTVEQQKLFVAMVRDVTDQKRFEQALAAEKESLAVTLRSIGDGVITTDIQGKVVMINNAGETLTGWSSRDAIGQSLKSIFDITIDLAAQAREQKSGFRNEAHSLLLSLPDNATLRSRDGVERVIEQVGLPRHHRTPA